MRFKATPAVYIFLIRDEQILLTRRCNTGYMDGFYMVPSGHVEAGEFPTAAMIREAKEEVGIDIKVEDLEFVQFLYRQKQDATGERVDVFFRCHKWSGEPVNTELDKCDDIRFFPLDNLPDNIVPYVKTVLNNMTEGLYFAEI